VRRSKALTAGGRQVVEIVNERQTDAGLMYGVIAGNGPESRFLWRYGADLDPTLLKEFKKRQRLRRQKARGEMLEARWTPQWWHEVTEMKVVSVGMDLHRVGSKGSCFCQCKLYLSLSLGVIQIMHMNECETAKDDQGKHPVSFLAIPRKGWHSFANNTA
jgi:hypothetical protein